MAANNSASSNSSAQHVCLLSAMCITGPSKNSAHRVCVQTAVHTTRTIKQQRALRVRSNSSKRACYQQCVQRGPSQNSAHRACIQTAAHTTRAFKQQHAPCVRTNKHCAQRAPSNRSGQHACLSTTRMTYSFDKKRATRVPAYNSVLH
jgi:hypothetical protein